MTKNLWFIVPLRDFAFICCDNHRECKACATKVEGIVGQEVESGPHYIECGVCTRKGHDKRQKRKLDSVATAEALDSIAEEQAPSLPPRAQEPDGKVRELAKELSVIDCLAAVVTDYRHLNAATTPNCPRVSYEN